jgi:flagellar hook-length control protein FliK
VPASGPAAAKPQADSNAGGQQPQQQSSTLQQQGSPRPSVPVQQPHADAPAAPGAPAAAPAPATPPAPAAHTAARSAPIAPPTPVPLARAAETVEHVLRLASANGVTHARIQLHPAELGTVDVHLRQTADGLVAKVIAHSPDAVQQLQQAAGDLRRSLEQQGLNLLGLDVGHSGDERSAGRSGEGPSDGRPGPGGDQNGESAADEATTTSSMQLPNGVLVDVLA